MSDFIKVTTFFGIVAILFISALIFNRCESTNNIEELEATIINKNKEIKDYEARCVELFLENDSLSNIADSLNSEISVLKYKLLRIKEYNNIAANGNNIKYLRGWINRVIND